MEGDCAWCAAGKYQTGVGLVAEANCTWCVAGKYQSGSGVDAVVLACGSVECTWIADAESERGCEKGINRREGGAVESRIQR